MRFLKKMADARLIDLFYCYLRLFRNPEREILANKCALALTLGLCLTFFEDQHQLSEKIATTISCHNELPLFLLSLLIVLGYISKPFYLYVSLSVLIETQKGNNGRYENKYMLFFFAFGYLMGLLVVIGKAFVGIK